MIKKLIVKASQIATPKGSHAKFGEEMNDLTIIKNGVIVIEDGMIQEVGPAADILRSYDSGSYDFVDATEKCVVPGFVDSHTHFIFGGYRPDEFYMRLNGASYMEIMNAGGGIQNTVNATRSSSFDKLFQAGLDRLDAMVDYGITTVEGKSGYGLDAETELLQLKVQSQLNEAHPVDVVSTFLGAHAVPPEFKGRNEAYIEFLIQNVLPKVVEEKLAEFCDVFCEDGVFSIALSRKLLQEAKKQGLEVKVHADEIEQLGGAELAAELLAVSADHLLEASDYGIEQLKNSEIVATLLPATAFCLNKRYADARKMIDQGCAVALASDFNPGSCFTQSVPLIFALACIQMKMTPEEALTAFTLNGAAALKRADSIGSIEPGKKADIVILKYPSYKYLSYHTAANLVEAVIKDGKIVKQLAPNKRYAEV
ncbi:imidazolonepropionase [Heyndrickxia acidiproducens]|uniref:imidazolonepropionase n=1 Tax=Heyndrickxia acidiproducens TaxID=1121084 RepID=UPI000370F2BF|nr:imidazolonepropionase [Heyndrickxia acidiproducens]